MYLKDKYRCQGAEWERQLLSLACSSILQLRMLIKCKYSSVQGNALQLLYQLRLAPNQALHITNSNCSYTHVSAHSTTAICESLEGQFDDSVIISSTDPAVEGTIMVFHCPTGSVSFSLTCMENGKWEPAPYKVNCSAG